jgi:hypothetical protein
MLSAMGPRACFLIILGLLLATAGEAQKKRFTFAWSSAMAPGTEVAAQYSAEILRVDGRATTKSTVFRTGTLTLESEGETWRLRRQANGPVFRWLNSYQDFLDHLPQLATTVVVDRAGRFQGATMTAKALERGEELVAQLPEAGREAAGRQISPAALEARWADLWHLGVELWLGRPYRKGTTFTTHRTVQIPASGGTMAVELTAEVLRKVPCTPQQRRKKCVEVQVVERVDPDRLTAALATAALAAYQGAVVGAMERRFTAVVAPKTLRPYTYTFHHRLEQEPPEGKGLTLEEVTRNWTFE